MERPSLLVSRVAKPCGSLLASRAAKPWQGRTLEGSGRSGARVGPPWLLRGDVVTFGFEAHETLARAYSKRLWR